MTCGRYATRENTIPCYVNDKWVDVVHEALTRGRYWYAMVYKSKAILRCIIRTKEAVLDRSIDGYILYN